MPDNMEQLVDGLVEQIVKISIGFIKTNSEKLVILANKPSSEWTEDDFKIAKAAMSAATVMLKTGRIKED